MPQRLTALQSPVIGGQLAGDRIRVCPRCHMRGDHDSRMTAEGMIVGKGFDAKDVELCPGELAAVERGDQVLVDQVSAPGDVDQVGAPLHADEERFGEDIRGGRCQRKKVDEQIALGQQGLETLGSVVGCDTGHDARRPAPPGGGIALLVKAARGPPAQLTETENKVANTDRSTLAS